MNERMTKQFKLSYALTFLPAAIMLVWVLYGAIFGYKYNFISSLGNRELLYGLGGAGEVIDELGMRLLLTPVWWISLLTHVILSLHFTARTIAYKRTDSFDMSQRAQDIFSVAAVAMDVLFLLGLARRF